MTREQVKWLLTLDLSYSIKFPKRDLRNGFLIAEILNRYFPEEVSMHSFVNGTSSVNKSANWALLSKQMKRLGIRCTAEEIANISDGEGDDAMKMLIRLHRTLSELNKGQGGGAEVTSPFPNGGMWAAARPGCA